MEIIKDNIEKLLQETNYISIQKYSDMQLNCLYNYCNFLKEYEEELEVTNNTSLEAILYSQYYWFSRLADRFQEVYGFDAGIEQQQFMMIEEMEQRLEHVDWGFVERLQRGNG